MSAKASTGMSGWRTRLWGWPISSSTRKPLVRMKAALAYWMWLEVSVADNRVSLPGNSYSCWVIGRLVRMRPSSWFLGVENSSCAGRRMTVQQGRVRAS